MYNRNTRAHPQMQKLAQTHWHVHTQAHRHACGHTYSFSGEEGRRPMCSGPVAFGWLGGERVSRPPWTRLVTSRMGQGGYAVPSPWRVEGHPPPKTSCLALEPFPGLAPAALPGRPKKLHDYAPLQRKTWRFLTATCILWASLRKKVWARLRRKGIWIWVCQNQEPHWATLLSI